MKLVKYQVVSNGDPDFEDVSCSVTTELADLAYTWHGDDTGRWPTFLEEISSDGQMKVVRIYNKIHFSLSLD